MADSDIMQPLGTVTNYEGRPQDTFRDYDGLDLHAITVLLPAGVAELEQRIAAYWQELACYRLRTADLTGFNLDEARASLLTLPGVGDPSDLQDVYWLEVGRRLHTLRGYGGYGELRRLHALLMTTKTSAEG